MTATKLARRASALAFACFVLAALAPTADAAPLPPPAYDGVGIGQGVVSTFSIRPSIFDPLLQAGGPYSEATLSSQAGGASHAIAAQIFPGKFAIGAVGCAGVKGWVQANYPPTDDCKPEQKDTLFESPHSDLASGTDAEPERTLRATADTVLNTILDRSSIRLGKMRAQALFADSVGEVHTHNYELRADPAQPPILSIADLRVLGTGSQDGAAIVNEAIVTARDVSIMNGTMTIGLLIARARTSSDGTNAGAEASLTFADVSVLVNGTRHRATIDSHGVRINEPNLSRAQEIGLEEEFQEGLSDANVRITVAQPVEIVEGATADASVGGLSISVAGTIPNVPIPHELAPTLAEVIEKIPTNCVNDFEPEGLPEVPLCFGPGVLPGAGNEIIVGLQIGAAQASTNAAEAFDFGGGGCTTCGPIDPIAPPTDPLPAGPIVLPGSNTTTTVTQGPTTQPSGPLLGVFANLPASALLWAGVALLFLAVGATLGPSLRHARAG